MDVITQGQKSMRVLGSGQAYRLEKLPESLVPLTLAWEADLGRNVVIHHGEPVIKLPQRQLAAHFA